MFTVRLPAARRASIASARMRAVPQSGRLAGRGSLHVHFYRRLAALRCPGCPPRRNFQTEQLRPRTAKTMVSRPHVRLRDGRGRRNDRWRIAMDLRFALFERIAQDSVLRRLLVNYADRLDDPAFPPGPTDDTCYLTMEWTTDDRTNTSPEGESLTVRAHVPRHRSRGAFLSRCRTAAAGRGLAVDDADGSITVAAPGDVAGRRTDRGRHDLQDQDLRRGCRTGTKGPALPGRSRCDRFRTSGRRCSASLSAADRASRRAAPPRSSPGTPMTGVADHGMLMVYRTW